MYRILNDYGKGYIVIASRPGNGKTSTILDNIKIDLLNNKKVLFFSLENSERSIIERDKCFKTSNLVILDNPVKKMDDIKDNITKHNPNVVYIDYFDLLPNKDGANDFFHQLSVTNNIPIVVAHNLSNENDLDMLDKSDNYFLLYINDKKRLDVRKFK